MSSWPVLNGKFPVTRFIEWLTCKFVNNACHKSFANRTFEVTSSSNLFWLSNTACNWKVLLTNFSNSVFSNLQFYWLAFKVRSISYEPGKKLSKFLTTLLIHFSRILPLNTSYQQNDWWASFINKMYCS